jgi:hypothetical protein
MRLKIEAGSYTLEPVTDSDERELAEYVGRHLKVVPAALSATRSRRKAPIRTKAGKAK